MNCSPSGHKHVGIDAIQPNLKIFQPVLIMAMLVLLTACSTAPRAKPGMQVTYVKYPVDKDSETGVHETLILQVESIGRRNWQDGQGNTFIARRVLPHGRYYGQNDSILEYYRGWTFDGLFPLKVGNSVTEKKPLLLRNPIGMFAPDYETCEVTGREPFELMGKTLSAFQIYCEYETGFFLTWHMSFLYHPDVPVFLRRHTYNIVSPDVFEDLVDIQYQ